MSAQPPPPAPVCQWSGQTYDLNYNNNCFADASQSTLCSDHPLTTAANSMNGMACAGQCCRATG